MLTPEQINLFEFNDVVRLYNQLNIDITADIIERVSQYQELTNTTKYQLQVLKQSDGTEVFNKALNETSMLTSDTKKALKSLYEEVAKADMQSYENLYEYQGKTYRLSESQYKIINQSLKSTNRTLKNLTNSIAFSSQQAYINTVDSAYLKAISGAFSYSTSIDMAVQELANQGITLKDSLGRNVQLEVAVRRNILAGIRDTARALDKDISDYLGCDGYEVSAHIGARPTHAEAQGKQYAITREKAKEFGVGLWSDVSDLWNEYNCRHDYFGIILGISEPSYTNKELTEMKNATVTLNGKEVSYYEATQKQRALENSIRKTKRAISTLEQAGQDATTQKAQLQKLQQSLTKLTNETGLAKDYNRLKISSSNSIKYKDATEELINSEIYKERNFKNQNFVVGSDGNEYIVDGKNVILDHTESEENIALWYGQKMNTDINMLPRVCNPSAVKTADFTAKTTGYTWEIKEPTSSNAKNIITNSFKHQKEKAQRFIIDIHNSKVNVEELINELKYNLNNERYYSWIEEVIIKNNEEVIKFYRK